MAMSFQAASIAPTAPKPLTHCAACGEPLYAGYPLQTVPGGAMHVGCHVLEMNKRSARHLEVVPDS
jgi:hypothetical protein